MAMAVATVRAISVATFKAMPTSMSMMTELAEIEVVAASKKLVAKAGGNYMAAAERYR